MKLNFYICISFTEEIIFRKSRLGSKLCGGRFRQRCLMDAEESEEEVVETDTEFGTPLLNLQQLVEQVKRLNWEDLVRLAAEVGNELQARVVRQAVIDAEVVENLESAPWRNQRQQAEAKGKGKGGRRRGRPY